MSTVDVTAKNEGDFGDVVDLTPDSGPVIATDRVGLAHIVPKKKRLTKARRRALRPPKFAQALEDVLFRGPVPKDPAEIRKLKNRRRRMRQGRI